MDNTPWDPREPYRIADYFKGIDYRYNEHGQMRSERKDWHGLLQGKHQLHPSVKRMLDLFRPHDVEQLVLEWPHVSDTDESRLAYTRNVQDGERNRQLVTSIGKYLSRHWAHVEDHIRRDAQALYSVDERYIVATLPEFVQAVEDGPRSCMASKYNTIRFLAQDAEQMRAWFKDPTGVAPNWAIHPYAAYEPQLGWRMAVRWSTTGGMGRRIDGRALLWRDPEITEGNYVFVRTYKRNMSDPIEGWSESDFALQAWLEQHGHELVDQWPDEACLRTPLVPGSTDIYAPYIDGGNRWLTFLDEPKSLTSFADNGGNKYLCENTKAQVSVNNGRNDEDDEDEDEDANTFTCEHCDTRTHDDRGIWVGRREETHVCDDCLNDHFVEVRGANGRVSGYDEYYIHSNNAISVGDGDFHIDSEHVPNCVVFSDSEDGYIRRENAVSIDDEWYHEDDDDIVLDYRGTYRLADECVCCEDINDAYVLEEDAFQSDTTSLWYSTAEALAEAEAETEAEPEHEEST